MYFNKKIKNVLKLYNLGKLGFNGVKKEIDKLFKDYRKDHFDYLESLLYPETAYGIRIPSQMPVPSSTFQFKSSRLLKTNTSGCLLMKCNPFFLAQESLIGSYIRWLRTVTLNNRQYYTYNDTYISNYVTSFVYYNGNNLDGYVNLDSDRYAVEDIGQVIPNDIYNSYRLVSASMNVKYVGPLEESSGVIGGSIILEDFKDINSPIYSTPRAHLTNVPVRDPLPYDPSHLTSYGSQNIGKFGNFDILRDAYYHTENNCLEGLRLLYFPKDNSYEEFVPILKDTKQLKVFFNALDYDQYGVPVEIDPKYFYADSDIYKDGFNWFSYCQGLPANKECIRVDFCFNFECMVTNEFANFCPYEIRPYCIDYNKKKEIFDVVKNNVVGKVNK